jgi:hypothetical protein
MQEESILQGQLDSLERRRSYSNNNWRRDIRRRKSCGDKNIGYNGLRKGKRITNYFIEP